MSKPRIFISIHYLEIGGAEISLIGLLNAIDYSQCDVDLFVYSHQGELMKLLPQEVNLLPEIRKYSFIEKPITSCIKYGYWDLALGRLWAKVQARSFAKRNKIKKMNNSVYHYLMQNIIRFLPKIASDVEYDLAISYLHPFHIIRDKVKAKKKVGWIHTDFNYFDTDKESELPVWNSLDYIISISDKITESFHQVFPQLDNKIIMIENILPKEYIDAKLTEFDYSFPSVEGRVNLLSVGRFSHQKNFENIPQILNLIRNQGIDVYWYLIGFGGDEMLIRGAIDREGMQDYVIILGKKENPYPYIKACDIYVQPSRYEGKSVVVREAQYLRKPVVITDYPTAKSQIRDGYDGVIVPLNNEDCARGICDFIRNRELQKSIIDYVSVNDYTNMGEISKLYDLI